MPEGGRAIINCVIGDLAGRVQWTKDGLTLGKLHNSQLDNLDMTLTASNTSECVVMVGYCFIET